MPTPTRSPLRRAVCAALLLTQLTACMTWRPVSGTLDQQVGSAPIPHARLTLSGGAELPLNDVTVRADSVVGYTDNPRQRQALPVADVASIHRRQISATKTTVAVGLTALVPLAAALGSGGGDIWGPDFPSGP